MFIFYDLIFLVIAIFYLPVYLFRGKFHAGFWQRLGFLPQDTGKIDRPIWIHAVSVGEVKVVAGLIQELRKAYPKKSFVISTVTPTGNKVAQGIASAKDLVIYLPLDLSWIVRAVINKVNPSCFVLAETEIWPNLISYLHKKHIPIITVNGRISDASFRGYKSIIILLKPVIRKVDLFCVQGERDAERLLKLGALNEKVRVTGNMKFDSAMLSEAKFDSSTLKKKIGLSQDELLLVCGSTHPGEEEIILSAYKELKNEFPDLRLLIAPRHPERSKEIASIVERFGFFPLGISTFSEETTRQQNNNVLVFILDTIGELVSFYAIADVVFVGGSLIKKGGQNILEPASLGKPVIFGPYMFNFRDIADLFLKNQAAVMASGKEELVVGIRDLLNNPARSVRLTVVARDLILKNVGATKRNADLIMGQVK